MIDATMMRTERIERWTSLTWKCPSEVYGEGNFVLYANPGPNDIKQGKCGDCYFLTSLSSLAEYPDRIKKIFLTHEVNAAGCFAVSASSVQPRLDLRRHCAQEFCWSILHQYFQKHKNDRHLFCFPLCFRKIHFFSG